MSMTGLQIYKLLPNKNCKECGVPTCLAFAMKLAAKSDDPKKCPYISENALEILGALQRPPIQKLSFNLTDKTIALGAETVLYRHEKTFVNKPLIALELNDILTDEEFKQKIEEIALYRFERVGEQLFPEAISLLYESNNPENFLNKFKIIQNINKIILLSKIDTEILNQILQIEKNQSRLIINCLNKQNINSYKEFSSVKDMKFVLESDDIDSLFELVNAAENMGFKNIILKIKFRTISELLEFNVYLRRAAIKKLFKPAGYPILTECGDELFTAIVGICKYSSIIILKKYCAETIFPLLTLSQNIFTNPQKPLQIQSGIYNIGEPTNSSPLLVTTNFSLTYFIVSGEIENSPYSSRLLITDSDGMSVLTAWSANKFSADIIAKCLKNSNVEQELNHRKLIIPGYVAVLKGEIEDELAGWEILVGPQEAADIPEYLKEVWQNET